MHAPLLEGGAAAAIAALAAHADTGVRAHAMATLLALAQGSRETRQALEEALGMGALRELLARQQILCPRPLLPSFPSTSTYRLPRAPGDRIARAWC